MSHTAFWSPLPSLGRLSPRWSSLFTGRPAQMPLSPLSIAWLPASSFMVSIDDTGPPLNDGEPRLVVPLLMSPGPPRLQSLLLSRLCPSDVTAPVPAQLPL